MLFNAREFEQSFDNKTLKKGLLFFERAKVLLTAHGAAYDYEFLIDDHTALTLKKRGDKILSYSCACHQPGFCSHLSAVLFYFQKDALGISVKSKRASSKRMKKGGDLARFLKEMSHSAEKDFLSACPKAETLLSGHKSNDIYQFRDKHFYVFCTGIRSVIVPYLEIKALKQAQLNEMLGQLKEIKTSVLSQAENAEPLLYFHLALLCELPMIFNNRLLGDETAILEFFVESCESLGIYYEAGTSLEVKDNWLLATLFAAQIKNRMALEALNFLLPRLLCFTTQRTNLELVKKAVNKRKNKMILPGEFDKITILKLEVAIRDAELFNTAYPFKIYRETPEFVIAAAELKFCIGNNEAAFGILEDFYDTIKNEMANSLPAYLNYMINKANDYHFRELEIRYLEESLTYNLYLAPKQLERFFELVPETKRSAEIDRLIIRIKSFSADYALDKISMLLLRDNRADALVNELKHYKNKFSLVHKIAIQKLPLLEDEFLTLYTQHLVQALTDAAYVQYHEQIFLTSKKILDQLPAAKANELVSTVLEKLGALSYISRFIRELFPGVNPQA